MHSFYALKVHADRKLRLSALADVQMLFRQTKNTHSLVKNFAEQKFQVQRNRETGHFSDPVSTCARLREFLLSSPVVVSELCLLLLELVVYVGPELLQLAEKVSPVLLSLNLQLRDTVLRLAKTTGPSEERLFIKTSMTMENDVYCVITNGPRQASYDTTVNAIRCIMLYIGWWYDVSSSMDAECCPSSTIS